jgi:hypothetical protein
MYMSRPSEYSNDNYVKTESLLQVEVCIGLYFKAVHLLTPPVTEVLMWVKVCTCLGHVTISTIC